MFKSTVHNNYVDLPLSPPYPEWCAIEVEIIPAYLYNSHYTKKWQVDFIVGMLTESYLVNLPTLKKDKRE